MRTAFKSSFPHSRAAVQENSLQVVTCVEQIKVFRMKGFGLVQLHSTTFPEDLNMFLLIFKHFPSTLYKFRLQLF